MSQFGAILAVIMLMAIIAVGTVFAIGIFAEAEQAHNMTGSEYEDQYNSTVDITIGAIGIVSFVPYVLGLLVVIIVLFLAWKYLH